MPIPDFDHNLVLPPHAGNPARIGDVSPYVCTSLELCTKFSTSPERVAILRGFLSFRAELATHGLNDGFQWLDGSFLEHVEVRELRPPNDLDLVTIFWNYDDAAQHQLVQNFPEFLDSDLSKANYHLDHYPFDAAYQPEFTVSYARYWIQLFSHNRDSVWKGMLQISLNTPQDDHDALAYLNTL